jgi:hypothetical protein
MYMWNVELEIIQQVYYVPLMNAEIVTSHLFGCPLFTPSFTLLQEQMSPMRKTDEDQELFNDYC